MYTSVIGLELDGILKIMTGIGLPFYGCAWIYVRRAHNPTALHTHVIGGLLSITPPLLID